MVEITAFRLERILQLMTALEFITGHVVYLTDIRDFSCSENKVKKFLKRHKILKQFPNSFDFSYALSSYRLQNVLCQSISFCVEPKIYLHFASHKHFVPDKKMICIQYNWFLCRHKSFWRGTKRNQIFGLTQKIWIGTKHFPTCKRARH